MSPCSSLCKDQVCTQYKFLTQCKQHIQYRMECMSYLMSSNTLLHSHTSWFYHWVLYSKKSCKLHMFYCWHKSGKCPYIWSIWSCTRSNYSNTRISLLYYSEFSYLKKDMSCTRFHWCMCHNCSGISDSQVLSCHRRSTEGKYMKNLILIWEY